MDDDKQELRRRACASLAQLVKVKRAELAALHASIALMGGDKPGAARAILELESALKSVNCDALWAELERQRDGYGDAREAWRYRSLWRARLQRMDAKPAG